MDAEGKCDGGENQIQRAGQEELRGQIGHEQRRQIAVIRRGKRAKRLQNEDRRSGAFAEMAEIAAGIFLKTGTEGDQSPTDEECADADHRQRCDHARAAQQQSQHDAVLVADARGSLFATRYARI